MFSSLLHKIFHSYIKKNTTLFLILISGILNGIAYNYYIYWLSWFSLVPFLFAINNKSVKQAFIIGISSGGISGLILFNWMFTSVQRFIGDQNYYLGIIIIIVSSLFLSLWWGAWAAINNWFVSKKRVSLATSILFGATLWAFLEVLRSHIPANIPWFYYSSILSQTTNPYLIQIVSITGVAGISFSIAIVNILIFHSIRSRKKEYFISAVLVFSIYLSLNYILFNTNTEYTGKPLKFALMQENINAETRWQPETGDSLAKIYFNMSEKANSEKPDFIVWSEGSIPWEFTPDDDLFKNALRITYPSKATHLFGSMYPADKYENKVYNSVIVSEFDGKIKSRYDKLKLLSAIEKPLVSLDFLKFDFFSSGINDKLICGKNRQMSRSKNCNLGISICNESLSFSPILETVKQGAEILVNLSNDAWMTDSMLPFQHFYTTILRAVENNRYVVMNSNKGISGIISNKGEIIVSSSSNMSNIVIGEAKRVSQKSFYFKNKYLSSISLLIGLITLIIIRKRGGNEKK